MIIIIIATSAKIIFNKHWSDVTMPSQVKPTTAQKTIFSFSIRPEKMVFPKKLRWDLIFLLLSGNMIFIFPRDMILPLGGKWKMIFLKKIHGDMIFSSNVPKRWPFQKGTWSFLYYIHCMKNNIFVKLLNVNIIFS